MKDPMAPDSAPEGSLGFLLADIARLMRRNVDRRLQSLHLTQAQWRAIFHLSRNEGMTQVALADLLDIQPITLTRLIDRLEAAGWVERREHPQDRRAVSLWLTAKCQPILVEMQARATETLADAVGKLSVTQQQRLKEDLQRIKQNLLAAEHDATAGHSTARISKDVRRDTGYRAP
jgi:DNA-binding MarR family transcriptional regulator